MANNNTNPPWYKQKFPRSRYLTHGLPYDLNPYTIAQEITGLILPNEASKLNWEMAKTVVDQKNKKREFLIKYDDTPVKTTRGYVMTIEMLHVDHRGFMYHAEGETEVECNQNFWPMVPLLIANYFSPRIVGRPNVNN